MATKRRGNCYVTCEALYHLLGGAKSGLRVFTLKHEGDTHWYLEKWVTHWSGWEEEMVMRIDPTVKQFKRKPDYSKGKRIGFLTKQPSKRAKALMEKLVWQ